MVESDPASAMDYFQRAIHAGLDAAACTKSGRSMNIGPLAVAQRACWADHAGRARHRIARPGSGW